MKQLILLITMFISLSLSAQVIKKDHQRHIAAGLAIGGTGAQISESLFDGKHKELITFGSTFIIASGWELLWQNEPGNHFDSVDVLMTMLGAVAAYGLDRLGFSNIISVAIGVGWLGFSVNLDN